MSRVSPGQEYAADLFTEEDEGSFFQLLHFK